MLIAPTPMRDAMGVRYGGLAPLGLGADWSIGDGVDCLSDTLSSASCVKRRQLGAPSCSKFLGKTWLQY